MLFGEFDFNSYKCFYCTYCSSGQPAGRWHRHPARFRHSPDTSSHSKAPSRAISRISVFSNNDNHHSPTVSESVCDSGDTFPLSMHRSSTWITSELQQQHKRNTINTHMPDGPAKWKLGKFVTPFDDISNELTGGLGLFSWWAWPEARGTQGRQVHVRH